MDLIGLPREGEAEPEHLPGAVLDLVGVTPTEAAMVGDSLLDDVEGARALGMRAILLDREGRFPNRDDALPTLLALPALLAST